MDNTYISALVGQTIIHIERTADDQKLKFFTADKVFEFYHSQDCSEDVSIEDVTGDFEDLINSPILVAQESSSDKKLNDEIDKDEFDECSLWTFYKFATVKGWVDVRWLGSSNGYYSMSVSLLCRDYDESDVAAMIKKEHNLLDKGLAKVVNVVNAVNVNSLDKIEKPLLESMKKIKI